MFYLENIYLTRKINNQSSPKTGKIKNNCLILIFMI